jgi:hypothetical protein
MADGVGIGTNWQIIRRTVGRWVTPASAPTDIMPVVVEE